MPRYAVLLTLDARDDRQADHIVWEMRRAFRDEGGPFLGYEQKVAIPDEWDPLTFAEAAQRILEGPP